MRTLAILPAIAVAVVSFACSSESDGGGSSDGTAAGFSDTGWSVTPPSSGTRLRAKVITGGGARELVAFYDTARGEDCTFQAVKGDRMFCLPRSVLGAQSGAFADAACKQPLMVVPSCAAGVKYAVTIGSSACGQSEVQTLQPIGGQASAAYTSNGASCVAQASTPGSVALGDAIPWTDFVEARVSGEERDGLIENVAVASDGARQHLGYRSAKLGADCTFQPMADGVTRCVPGTTTGRIIYSDAACTQPAAAFPNGPRNGSCPAPQLLSDATPGSACTRAIYSVDAPGSGSAPETGYVETGSSSGASCTGGSRISSSASSVTNITASLHAVARLTGGGGGRLVPALVPRDGGDALVPAWHDNERNVDCTFSKASDGKIRCLPSGTSTFVFYTDTACKSPGRIAPATAARSCGETGSRFARVTESVCGATANQNPPTNPSPVIGTPAIELKTDVFALSGESRDAGPSSIETSPGRCAQVAGVLGVVDATVVNPADYVEATIATE